MGEEKDIVDKLYDLCYETRKEIESHRNDEPYLIQREAMFRKILEEAEKSDKFSDSVKSRFPTAGTKIASGLHMLRISSGHEMAISEIKGGCNLLLMGIQGDREAKQGYTQTA